MKIPLVRAARRSLARPPELVAALSPALLATPTEAQKPPPCRATAQQPCPARPATASTDTVAITLEEALARATGESQEVRLARSEVALAEAQVTSARSAALPQLDGTINYTRTFDSPFRTEGISIPDSLIFDPDTTASLVERVRYLERRTPTAGLGGLGSLFGDLPFGQQNSYVAALTGTQTLFSGGRIGAGLRIADEYRAATQLGVTEQVAEIELQTRTAYLRALLSQELERIAAAAVTQAETFLAQERLRLEAGTSSELAVLRAEVALENLRPDLVEARNASELAALDLKRLVDIPLTSPVALTTPLRAPSESELAETRVPPELLISQRASVQAAERQVAIREQQVRIARSAYLPSIDLRVNYGRQAFPGQVFDLGGQPWRTDFTAVFGVKVPIFSGFRTQADVEQARVTLDQERLRLAQLRENVQLQYEQALGERERAASSLTARQRTVEQAQRVHDLTVLRYEQGLATQLEVTDARLSLLQSRTNLAQAIADFYLADAGVTRALGTTTPRVSRPGSPRGSAASARPGGTPTNSTSPTTARSRVP